MRCRQLAQGSQLGIGLRLAFPDIQHGLQIRPLWQQAAQRGVVHHGTATGIDQPGARPERSQTRRIEQMARRGVQRRVQADHVAFFDDPLQADEIAALGGLPGRVAHPYLPAETTQQIDQTPTDLPRPDHAIDARSRVSALTLGQGQHAA